MTKGPRRSRHRAAPVPWAAPVPVVLSEEYAREVERSTSKLERQYAAAQKRVERARARLTRARDAAATAKREDRARAIIANLETALAEREGELEGYRRMMVTVPASANHRGTKSFRPVPPDRQ